MRKSYFQSMVISVFFVCLTLIFAACSTTQEPENRRAEIPQVRDVPFQARDTDELRKKVIVLPFVDGGIARAQTVKEIARRTVVEDLLATKNFIVFNNSDLPQDVMTFLKENKEFDMVALSRMAANMGAAAIIEGRIMDVQARRMGEEIGVFRKLHAQVDVTVQVRVFGAKTAREIFNSVKKATVETETTRVGENAANDRFLEEDPNLVRAGVRKAFKETVGGIVKSIDKMGWEGRIALVNGEKIFINAGRISGIQIGDILKITEEGDEVFDPDTGSFIGQAPGRMKGTVEVVSYFGKDGAISIVHSGSGFKENDRVELY